MFDFARVEVGSDQLSRICLGEGEDGALDGGSLGEAAHRREGIAVVVLAWGVAMRGAMAMDTGDELGRGGVDGATEGLQLARLLPFVSGLVEEKLGMGRRRVVMDATHRQDRVGVVVVVLVLRHVAVVALPRRRASSSMRHGSCEFYEWRIVCVCCLQAPKGLLSRSLSLFLYLCGMTSLSHSLCLVLSHMNVTSWMPALQFPHPTPVIFEL